MTTPPTPPTDNLAAEGGPRSEMSDEFAPHDSNGRLDRSTCGLCSGAYVECSRCGIYLCECTRSETCEPDPTAEREGLAEEIAEVLMRHQRIPHYGSDPGLNRCTGCDNLLGETDGSNSPRHVAHLADALADLLAARDRRVRAEAWDEALTHVWQLNDPAYTILTDTESIHPLLTRNDVEQARRENPYREADE